MGKARDWDWVDVKTALLRKGVTFSDIARKHGVERCTILGVKTRFSPLNQTRIAAALGVQPAIIWPDRYGRRDVARRA